MKTIGLILIVVGIIALAYQGITYTQREKHDVLGIIEVETKEKKTIPIQPIIGAVILVAGITLVVADRKGKAA